MEVIWSMHNIRRRAWNYFAAHNRQGPDFPKSHHEPFRRRSCYHIICTVPSTDETKSDVFIAFAGACGSGQT